MIEKDGAICVLSLNRPDALNAFNHSLFEQLGKALDELAADDSVRVLIVTGAGGKAFAAGADIAVMKGYGEEQGREFSQLGHRIFDKLAAFPRPTIAAVNGFALGGGLECALACDVLIASEKAKLGLPEVTLGLIPGWGGTQRLVRRVGPGRAKKLIFSGNHVKADEALRIGLADDVVEHEKLLDEAKKLASDIAARGPEAVKFAKQAVDIGLRDGLEEGLRTEQRLFSKCFTTADTQEGIGAFLEKRKPDFKGK